jgi:transposase
MRVFEILSRDTDNEFSGQVHDVTQAEEPLLENLAPEAVIADKGYDPDALVEKLEARDITSVNPPKANRKEMRDCDFALYSERNLVERVFNKIKHYRAIATRFGASASWPTRFSLASCSSAWSYGSTDDTP